MDSFPRQAHLTPTMITEFYWDNGIDVSREGYDFVWAKWRMCQRKKEKLHGKKDEVITSDMKINSPFVYQ